MLNKKVRLSILAVLIGTAGANAQIINYVSGKVWSETLPADNVMNAGEEMMQGILITLKNASTDEIISTTVSSTNGYFEMPVYMTGTFYLKYDYPEAGYTLVDQRTGPGTADNSAANQVQESPIQ